MRCSVGGPPSPSIKFTIATEWACRSITSASAGVMFGRRMSSASSRPEAKLIPLNFAMKIVSGPIARMVSRRD